MDMIQEARRVLTQAEVSLRGLIERGVREHRYAEVAELAGLAERLTRLLRAQAPTSRNGDVSLPSKNKSLKAIGKTRKTKSGNSRAEYPRYERDGDKLVKVGWSKKKKEQYEHRAPHEAVVAFARHLASHVSVGQVFAVEDILPVPDPSGGEIPAYQIYLMLGWLRGMSAIVKKGRDGYALHDETLADDGLNELWEQLPEHGASRRR